MTVYSLIEHHSRTCERRYTNEYFLFQYRFEFYVIMYCSCLEGGFHIDWKLDLLKEVCKRVKGETFADRVTKSNPLKMVLRDRNKSYLLERPMLEVCYSYTDKPGSRVGKTYSMVNELEFSDWLTCSMNYKERYFEATRIISDDELGIFTPDDRYYNGVIMGELSELHSSNRDYLDELSDIQKIKFTDLLSRNILKLQTI